LSGIAGAIRRKTVRAAAAAFSSLALAIGLANAGPVSEDFSARPQFFAHARPPAIIAGPTDRALCYDAFAILHSSAAGALAQPQCLGPIGGAGDTQLRPARQR